jgi:ribose transport system substrate-binding protein
MHPPVKNTLVGLCCAAIALSLCLQLTASAKDIVYLTPGLDLPFWRYLSKGVESVAQKEGYGYQAFDSHNDAQTQLKNAQDAIARGVAGIVISPTDSSTCPSVLALAQKANIPVVIADNREGAYGTGKALVAAMKEKGMTDGTVGLVTISLTRNNGKLRTAGFRAALQEGGIKESALEQMQNYTASETFKYTQDMLTANPNMKGMFIETDQPTMGALRAIKAARRDGSILVAGFDGIPEFVDLLKKGEIVVSGMQQPYLMGVRSGEALFKHLKGEQVEKQVLVPIVIVTSKNIDEMLPTIKETVFANEMK